MPSISWSQSFALARLSQLQSFLVHITLKPFVKLHLLVPICMHSHPAFWFPLLSLMLVYLTQHIYSLNFSPFRREIDELTLPLLKNLIYPRSQSGKALRCYHLLKTTFQTRGGKEASYFSILDWF